MSTEKCFKVPVIMFNEFEEEEKKVFLIEFGANKEEVLEKTKQIISKINPDRTKYTLDLYSESLNPFGRSILEINLHEEFMKFKERRKAK